MRLRVLRPMLLAHNTTDFVDVGGAMAVHTGTSANLAQSEPALECAKAQIIAREGMPVLAMRLVTGPVRISLFMGKVCKGLNVFGVATSAISAGVMQFVSIWNRTYEKLVGKAMGANGCDTGYGNLAVPSVQASGEVPALRGRINHNLGEKFLRECFVFSRHTEQYNLSVLDARG